VRLQVGAAKGGKEGAGSGKAPVKHDPKAFKLQASQPSCKPSLRQLWCGVDRTCIEHSIDPSLE